MNKAVVVTGGSSGIGKAIAEAMVQSGVKVVNLDLVPAPSCSQIETRLIDLTDSTFLEQMLTELDKEFEVAGLVNNAGYAKTGSLEETDNDLLLKTFDLNLRCAAQCAKVFVPGMKRRGFGRLVNIASRSALGRELRTAYAASKGGLISMTRVWALELAKDGITANCVAPGPIATELFDSMNPVGSKRRDKMIREIPVNRIGKPEDVGNAVRFFLSEDSGFVNGQTLYVCGGLSVGVAPI